jgi:hypothetical protein
LETLASKRHSPGTALIVSSTGRLLRLDKFAEVVFAFMAYTSGHRIRRSIAPFIA